MNISAMLRSFCDAVERRDGKAFAALFTEDGVYHDVFYGAFDGREKIAALIDDWFRATEPAGQKKLAADIQLEAYANNVPYVPTGQFVVPTAYRKNLEGIIIAPVVFLWNVEKK